MLCMIFNTKMWNQFAMSQFFGFKVSGTETNPDIAFYQMRDNEALELNNSSFGYYNNMFVIGYLPTLLIFSPVLSSYNKKCILGICSIIWGVDMFLHAFATSITQLYLLALFLGLFQGCIESCLYLLIGELFAPQYRQRAYIGYSFIGLLYEPMKFAIAILISFTGWRVSWMIIGVWTMALGLIFTLTVYVPKGVVPNLGPNA